MHVSDLCTVLIGTHRLEVTEEDLNIISNSIPGANMSMMTATLELDTAWSRHLSEIEFACHVIKKFDEFLSEFGEDSFIPTIWIYDTSYPLEFIRAKNIVSSIAAVYSGGLCRIVDGEFKIQMKTDISATALSRGWLFQP